MLVMKGVAVAGSSKFPNCVLGGANSGCAGVAEFWVLVFGVSLSDNTITVDSVTFVEIVGGVRVSS